MPAIIRLRTLAETTSTIDEGPVGLHDKGQLGLPCRLLDRAVLDRTENMRLHQLSDRGYDRNDDCISKLSIGLCVGHWNAEIRPVSMPKAHKPCTFPRCQAARPSARLSDQNFRSILEVSGRKGAGDVVRTKQAVAK